MSTLSPPYVASDLYKVDDSVSTPRRSMSKHVGPVHGSGVVWQNGQPVLRMQDAVVETVVTHITRTTTSFAPITLPRLPEPDHLPFPAHLSPDIYPLALEPVPDDMKFFAMNLGGQRVIVHEDGSVAGPSTPLPSQMGGPGWRRSMNTSGFSSKLSRTGLVGALKDYEGKDARKRSLSFSRRSNATAPTPPVTEDGKSRARSPPRKRVRGLDDIAFKQDGALLSPLPSPEQDVPGLPSSSTMPNLGSGQEVAALVSLPSLISQFENLPDKLQQHIMMQLLRRSRMPTIQRVTAFASSALKRDFVSALPHELAVHVLKHVDTRTLARATRVSRKWKRMIDTERTVWRQRLVDDGLYRGLGTEEEEEEVLRQRMEILRWKDAAMKRSGTPSEDELMDLPSASTVPPPSAIGRPEMAIPLKHVYRRRFLLEQNWLHRKPAQRSFPGQGTNVVTCTQFDRDKIITASDDHSINVYDMRQGTLRKRLEGHEGGVWALEYCGDTLVTGSTDRTVRVWDLESYKELHTFHGHLSTVRCLQIVQPVLDEATGKYFPPFPVFVTGSRDSSLRVWRLPRKDEPRYNTINDEGIEEPLQPEDNPFHMHHLAGHTQAVRAIAAYGRLCMSASYDSTVRVWDIVKGKCLHTLTGHEARVYSLVYDRSRNRCASGSMDNTVKIWDVGTGECLYTLNGHTALVGLLESSPNHLVSAAADASLRVWDATTHSLKHILNSHGGAITCFAHDDTKVVSGSDGSLKLWDIKTGQYVRELIIGVHSVWQVVFKDNILVAATSRNGQTIFEIFDFGALDDASGVDDESLDRYKRPAWERNDLPRAYQFDDHDDIASPKSYRGRAASKGDRNLRRVGSRRLRSDAPLPHEGSRPGTSQHKQRPTVRQAMEYIASTSASSRDLHRIKHGAWSPTQPSPSLRDPFQFDMGGESGEPSGSSSRSHRQGRHQPATPTRAEAGPTRAHTRSVARRMAEVARRSATPTPAGSSSVTGPDYPWTTRSRVATRSHAHLGSRLGTNADAGHIEADEEFAGTQEGLRDEEWDLEDEDEDEEGVDREVGDDLGVHRGARRYNTSDAPALDIDDGSDPVDFDVDEGDYAYTDIADDGAGGSGGHAWEVDVD